MHHNESTQDMESKYKNFYNSLEDSSIWIHDYIN